MLNVIVLDVVRKFMPFSSSTRVSLDPDLVSARDCDEAIAFGRSGHGRPAILHHESPRS